MKNKTNSIHSTGSPFMRIEWLVDDGSVAVKRPVKYIYIVVYGMLYYLLWMCNQIVLYEESDQIGAVGAFGFL